MESSRRDLTPADFPARIGGDARLILEVGCNDGRDTLGFLQAFPQAKLWCFEPDPRPAARFIRNVRDPRAILTVVAASDGNGLSNWYASHGVPPNKAPWGDWDPEVAADWDLSGSICKPTGHVSYSKWVTFSTGLVVPTLALDDWRWMCNVSDIIDLLWADVQGAERLLIDGARKVLWQTRYFYCEFYDQPLYEGQPNRAEIEALLPGFETVGIFGDNLLMRNTALHP